jgi:hypothetical protein
MVYNADRFVRCAMAVLGSRMGSSSSRVPAEPGGVCQERPLPPMRCITVGAADQSALGHETAGLPGGRFERGKSVLN